MQKQSDRLAALKAKYQEAIRNKRAEIEALQQKIVLVEEVQADASLDAIDAAKGHYSELGITDAVRMAMNEFPDGARVTVADVRKHLLENGYVPKGKNLTISLGQTLKRMADRKKINSELTRDGKRMFWKQPAQYRVFAVSERQLTG